MINDEKGNPVASRAAPGVPFVDAAMRELICNRSNA